MPVRSTGCKQCKQCYSKLFIEPQPAPLLTCGTLLQFNCIKTYNLFARGVNNAYICTINNKQKPIP